MQPTKRKTLRESLRDSTNVLIVVAFAVFVELYLGWSTLLKPWELVPLGLAALGLILILTSYLVRALRIYTYFRPQMHGRLLTCIKLSWHHNFLNYVLPMRVGEVAFPVLMGRYFGIPATKSLPVLIWFRLMDLHTLLLLAILALPVLSTPPIAAYVIATCWIAIPWFGYRFNRQLTLKIEEKGSSGKSAFLGQALASLPQSHSLFFLVWFWTLVNWVTKLTVVVFGIMTFIDTAFLNALSAAIVGEATMVLPFHSVAGAGTYEAGLVGVLGLTGEPLKEALAGSLNLHLFLIMGVIVTGGCAWLLPSQSCKPDEPGQKTA